MRILLLSALAAGAFAALPGPVAAQDGIDCATATVILPPELADWNQREPLHAAGAVSGVETAPLSVGVAVDARLRPAADVRYVAPPQRADRAGGHGGLFSFEVAQPGTYRIAMGGSGWIDVLNGGRPASTSAHGHGPACSAIRKIVDFPLNRGRYVVQVTGNPEASVALLIARLP
ncbi:MAG: hypothetical protein ABS87_09610 [Sphingomonas sp. SCN 67-18]|uniref:homogentisate 1,2-dioxygenase n=1 Tax=uncultured Sphingomonas sp. TaxID=158754 RepID=UPI0008684AFA|nr:homogentisate 1,2-dioxygenase [Sphingomonas sp. SCN 67-18]ODU20595.1 MAG: hypothetical protein ABS87_09610 [Sphingomonas sp. SCN 67-18]